jgi:hypothetical protein
VRSKNEGAASNRNLPDPRQTGQRLTSIMIPPLMGGIADRWGVSESFFILGALMLLLCGPLALIVRRVGRFDPRASERSAARPIEALLGS